MIFTLQSIEGQWHRDMSRETTFNNFPRSMFSLFCTYLFILAVLNSVNANPADKIKNEGTYLSVGTIDARQASSIFHDPKEKKSPLLPNDYFSSFLPPPPRFIVKNMKLSSKTYHISNRRDSSLLPYDHVSSFLPPPPRSNVKIIKLHENIKKTHRISNRYYPWQYYPKEVYPHRLHLLLRV